MKNEFPVKNPQKIVNILVQIQIRFPKEHKFWIFRNFPFIKNCQKIPHKTFFKKLFSNFQISDLKKWVFQFSHQNHHRKNSSWKSGALFVAHDEPPLLSGGSLCPTFGFFGGGIASHLTVAGRPVLANGGALLCVASWVGGGRENADDDWGDGTRDWWPLNCGGAEFCCWKLCENFFKKVVFLVWNFLSRFFEKNRIFHNFGSKKLYFLLEIFAFFLIFLTKIWKKILTNKSRI